MLRFNALEFAVRKIWEVFYSGSKKYSKEGRILGKLGWYEQWGNGGAKDRTYGRIDKSLEQQKLYR